MSTVHRIEVRPRPGSRDPEGEAVRAEAAGLGLRVPEAVACSQVYLVEGELSPQQVDRVAGEILADPVTQVAVLGASPAEPDAAAAATVEVHPLPGVMDPDAEPIERAIAALLGTACRVQTGRRYDIRGLAPAEAVDFVQRSLANTVIHAVHDAPWTPESLPTGHPRPAESREVPLTHLDDAALERLSREAHLFLDLHEMHALRDHYRSLGREPREIELETLAQTWSEHCVHKTLKARVRFHGHLPPTPDGRERPGHETAADGSIVIDNLLKSTVAAATRRLMDDGIDWCLSVFVDNAGIIAFDEEHAVCFKVETHNHPSAIEPYGGAATGIGGCIRDIIGTGLAARPVAATDIFCVAHPDRWSRPGEELEGRRPLPAGCLHPARILRQVVAGVRDYGNRMGIPTLNGAVWFDDGHVGNPLVFCGCVGVMPRDRTHGAPQAGDRIIALGGRTGRDGIHGATFSSAELTDTHAEEFSHAVQIGNAITEKKVLDVILAAREGGEGGRCLYRAITDCGAGGFSSAVGEMGEHLGAVVDLERAPVKYAGLTPTEIWISEAQERMVLAVAPEDVPALEALCREHEVELCDLGVFGTEDRELILRHEGREMGRMSMAFLHDGLPMPEREARWIAPADAASPAESASEPPAAADALTALLAHPNIASKHWIIRQYDHEVQGGSVVKPLVGPEQDGPSDAAVIRPVPGSSQGLGIACGLATGFRADPYRMTLAAVDECVRNLVCTGVDPDRIAILDNFCFPSCRKPENLGALVLAAEACHDAAVAYRTPFISGKDSLNNQFTTEDGVTIEIPPTLLVSGFGIVADLHAACTMDAKASGTLLVIVGETRAGLAGTHLAMLGLAPEATLAGGPPMTDLEAGPRRARRVARVIAEGIARSAHDCSEGGVLLAASEMAMAGRLGLELDLTLLPAEGELDPLEERFAETPSRYLLEVERARLDELDAALGGEPYAVIGRFTDAHDAVRDPAAGVDLSFETLLAAWRGTLDW